MKSTLGPRQRGGGHVSTCDWSTSHVTCSPLHPWCRQLPLPSPAHSGSSTWTYVTTYNTAPVPVTIWAMGTIWTTKWVLHRMLLFIITSQFHKIFKLLSQNCHLFFPLFSSFPFSWNFSPKMSKFHRKTVNKLITVYTHTPNVFGHDLCTKKLRPQIGFKIIKDMTINVYIKTNIILN